MVFLKRKTQPWEHYLRVVRETDIDEVDQSTRETLSFFGIDQETLTCVNEAKNIILPLKNEWIDHFFDRAKAIDDLKNKIFEPRSLETARQKINAYFDQFFAGNVNKEYVETRETIGKKLRDAQISIGSFLSAHHLLIQSMTLILMEKMSRDPDQMIKTVHAVQMLAAFDQRIIVGAYMENTLKSHLFRVSDLLQETIQVETIKQLIDKTEDQIQESHNVSAAMEQMSATIEEVANHAGRVAEGSKRAVEAAGTSKQIIGNALNNIEQVGDVYRQLDDQVKELHKEIEHTQSIANIIEEISAQTNLLALNASIEAARAGEHGRGFTVVAEEVRKLSDNTKEQIAKIASNLNRLQNVSTQLIQQIEHTGDQINQSVDSAQHAGEALNEIISYIEENSASTNQIAAMTEEQAAVITDISARNTAILDLGLETQTIAKQTATMINGLSGSIDQYRISLLNDHLHLKSNELPRVAKTDHLLWKWRIYNMLLGIQSVDSKQASSYQNCRLGKWYYGSLPTAIKNLPAYIELEEPHKQVHQLAAKAVECYENNKLAEAEQQLLYLEEASKKVIALLTELETRLKNA